MLNIFLLDPPSASFYEKKVAAKSSALCLLLVFFFFLALLDPPIASKPCFLMRRSRGFDPSSDMSLRRIIRCWPCMMWRNDDDALASLVLIFPSPPLLLLIIRPLPLFGKGFWVFWRLF